MPRRFLVASGTDGTQPERDIYTASIEGAAVIQQPAVLSDAERRAITRLTFFDPSQQVPPLVFSTPILPGSLEKPDDDDGLWENLEFKVRCLLQQDGESQAAKVDLELAVGGAFLIAIESFKVFGDGPKPSQPGNQPLAQLVKFTFEAGSQSATPPVLGKLGLVSAAAVSQNYKVATTLTSEGNAPIAGFRFSIDLPLRDDANVPQRIRPLNMSVTPSLISDPSFGSRIIVVQRPPVLPLTVDPIEMPGTAGIEHFILEIRRLPGPDVQRAYNAAIGQYLGALTTVRAGLPLSFLPAFEVPAETKATTFWRASFSIVDRQRAKEQLDAASDFRFRDANSPIPPNLLSIVTRTVEPFNHADAASPAAFEADVRFPNVPLVTKVGTRDALVAHLHVRRSPDVPDEARPASAFAGFRFEAANAASTLPALGARMGALDLTFGGSPAIPDLQSEDYARVHASLRAAAGAGVADDERPGPTRIEECGLKLSVLQIEASSEDDVPGEEFVAELERFQRPFASAPPTSGVVRPTEAEYQRSFRRDVPHILPIDATLKPARPFRLTVDEKAFEGRTQTVSLKLEQRTAELAAGSSDRFSLIVIDPHPFMVARINVPGFLSDLRDAVTNEIANWTNRATNPGWELLAGARGVDFVLPPQAIGEEMHRRQRDDLSPPAAGALSGVNFRFSPPTRARLHPSFFQQRFVEAPWNLRRILGFPGQRTPGATFDHLDFELLYGLKGTLENPFVRLAEIGARLGQLPGAQLPAIRWQHGSAQRDTYLFARTRWAALYPALLSRLAVLELWDERQPELLRLKEGDGLGYELRQDAELAYPILTEAPPPGIPRGTLKGSFAWAFESKRLYDALWRNPRATSGELTGPMFSALGGWGHQVARFDNERARIIATTRMGRVEALSIERVGCIGCFRNKAKHVITYKRTVAPSPQFTADQHPFLGLPLLRKFDEYVELLEPRRAFDSTTATADKSAFVRAAEFPEGDPPRIPVDSRWASDIGKFGWRIPLWNPTANPKVYPKPRVCFWMDTDRPGELQAVFNDEPHKLYFYTTVDPALNADTESWPLVEGVDFAAVVAIEDDPIAVRATSETDARELARKANGNAEAFEPAEEPLFEPGLGQFSYALVASPRPVNVVADRVTEAIGSALHTVTVMRGLRSVTRLPDTEVVYAEASRLFRQVGDHLSNALRAVLARIPSSAAFAEIEGELGKLRDQAKGHAVAFGAAIDRLATLVVPTTPDCGAFTQGLTNQLRLFRNEIEAQVEARLRSLTADVDALVRQQGGPLSNPKIRQQAKDAAKTFFAELRRQIRFGSAGFEDLIALAENTTPIVLSKAKAVIEAVKQAIKQGTLTRQKAQEQIAILERDALKLLDDAEAALSEAAALWGGGALDPIRSVFRRAAGAVREATGTATSALFDPDFTNFLEACEAAIAAAEKAVETFQRDVDRALKALEEAIKNYETDFETRIKALTARVDTAIDTAPDFDTLRKQIDAAFAAVVTSIEQAVSAHLQSLETVIAREAHTLCQALIAPVEQLFALLKHTTSPAVIDAFFARLIGAKSPGAKVREEIEKFLHACETDLRKCLALVEKRLHGLLDDDNNAIPDLSFDGALQLLRAFGDAPRVPQLEFNLDRTAFRFAQFDASNLLAQLPEVNLTPLLGIANKLENVLNPLQLRVPSIKLADRLVPFELENFDLSKVFPNFAGLDLSKLFAKIRVPKVANEHVKVTHGFDAQRQSGWVQVELDVPFGSEPAEVFSLFGVTLTILSAKFVGIGRVEGGAGQPPRRVFRGAITGDWDIKVGGFPIAILRDCTLTFDDSGHIGFNVTPDRVELQAALKFLSEVLSRFRYDEGGFSTALTPQGLMTSLDLPLPNVQAGAFGLANLSLRFRFGLLIQPAFEIQVGVGVARQKRPFTLTIFVLGGAGFLDFSLGYRPNTRELTTSLTIGVYASASLAISLGPVSGGVYAYFGLNVNYFADSRSGSELRIAIVLLFVGEVSLLGFISVSLSLGLSAEYRSGGGLVGRGFVNYRIKIGFFLDINVECAVEYHYGNPGALPTGSGDYLRAAERYLDMFQN